MHWRRHKCSGFAGFVFAGCFLALLNYYYWLNRTDNRNKFDRIINGISHKHIDRTPYIHCHGVSLSDSNIRRWLGWIHNNKVQELKSNGIAYSESTEHFWIYKKPESEIGRVWVDEWNQGISKSQVNINQVSIKISE